MENDNKKTTSTVIEVAKQNDKGIIPQSQNGFNIQELISQALVQKTPVETLERLLAMRDKLKAEWAKEQFDSALSKFQSEIPTIQKKKKVSFNTTNYSYAPLEDIVEQVKDAMGRNGLSYTFDTVEAEKAIKVICYAKHIAGHTQSSSLTIEIDQASKMNKTQQYGSANSYGKRYAFCNAFGILTGDEDNDGQTTKGKDIPANSVQSTPAPTSTTAKLSREYYCSKHDNTIALIPAGVSKRTGNEYKSFYICSQKGCKAPILNSDGEVVRMNPETGEMVIQPHKAEVVEEDSVTKARKILNDKVPKGDYPQ